LAVPRNAEAGATASSVSGSVEKGRQAFALNQALRDATCPHSCSHEWERQIDIAAEKIVT